MITEIISVGEELLIGKTVDTNATFFSKKLESLGFSCLYKSTVGDNKEHIINAIQNALTRADLIVISGGLGPTKDDLTTESLAEALCRKLVFYPEIAEKIRKMFVTINFKMSELNLKQAYLPEGAQELINEVGTAPGILINLESESNSGKPKIILSFPGVPSELYVMWDNHAAKFLEKYIDLKHYEKYVNLIGIGESNLVEEISDLIDSKDPLFRTYVDNYQIQLRISSQDKDLNAAKGRVERGIEKVRCVLDQYIFGYDLETLEGSVAKMLLLQNKTIAIAESCTGGLLSSRLTDVSGSSGYVFLNMVTYSNEAKINSLGVSSDIIEKHGAVSAETVEAMAKNIRSMVKTDIGLAISGIAGPAGGTPLKPVGTVFIGISDKNVTKSFKFNINPITNRKEAKWRFSQLALNVVRLHLK